MEISYVIPRMIFETVVGSRAYGIHHKDSDYDKAGVMIPGKEYFFGFLKFEQFMGFEEKDRVCYDIRKALRLIADCNPNMMDLLWVPDRCIQKMTPFWQQFVDQRDLFVSKRCRYTYSGYAIAQLRRIKTHRKFLLDPPKKAPVREEYGLRNPPIFPTSQLKAVVNAALEFIIEEEKQDFLDELDRLYGDYLVPLYTRFLMPEYRRTAMEWLQAGIKSQANTFISLGDTYLKDEYVEEAKKEVAFYEAKRDWDRYCSWKKSRNKARAELEEKFGMDCKHAAHLTRLMRMGMEILETGKVNVDRTGIDAEELKDIRNGAWPYEQVEQYADDSDKKLVELYKTSTLKKTPDIQRISDLCVNTVDSFFS